MIRKMFISLKIIILLSFISAGSCGKMSDKPKEIIKNNIPADLKPNQTIIEAIDNMDWIFGKNYKKWTPSESDIETAEKLIAECFNDQKRGTVNRLLNRKPEDYTMQFVGAIDEKDEKIIWVNCFCSSEIKYFKDWKTDLVLVKDGGNCFFNLKINVDNNTYYDVLVNGEA